MPPVRSLEVRGGCMRPLLRHGDSVLIEDVSPETLRLGDLIVILSRRSTDAPGTTLHASALAVHRLVWKSRRDGLTLWTKGDAVSQLDAETPASGLVGRVIAVRRAGGDWRTLEGWAAAAHRVVGVFATAAFVARPAAFAVLAAAARVLAGRRGLRPLRRVVTQAALAMEDP